MNSKYFILIIFFVISNQVISQKKESDLKNIERFCCYEWLPEFKDSILIIVDESKIIQSRKYCVLTKGKRRNYDLYCWTGSGGLETPTTWRDKLKMRFKGNFVFLKFGKRKYTYIVSKISEEEFLLIKIKSKTNS